MSVVVLASASGAPGVTTTALGLALAWPRDVVLVDADRSAPHAVLAGYLSGQAPRGLGVQGLLQAHRERRSLREALHANELPLPPMPPDRREPVSEIERRFVPGFSHLTSVDLFDSVWTPLLDAVRDAPFDVIIDAGRVGHRGLPADLASGADLVGLVCRTSLPSLAALRLHLPPLLDAAPPGRAGLVLVGPGRPYGASEVSQQFGVEIVAEVPWDPRGVAGLGEPDGLPKGWARRGVGAALTKLGIELRATMTRGLVEVTS